MTQQPQRNLSSLFSGVTCLPLGILALGCGPSPSPELTWMKGLLPGESSLVESAAWSPLQKMSSRYDHTATLLPNGKVLIVGGSNGTASALRSADLYDLNTGTWEETDSMTDARASHTATLLRNGKVLVAGGRDDAGQAVGTSEVYDPATKTWAKPVSTMKQARYDHTATLLLSGRVLVAGGVLDAEGEIILDSTELYDPEQGTWEAKDPMSYARSRHTATLLLPSGKVLVAGGTSSGSTSEAEESSTEGSSWTPVGQLRQARLGHAAALLPSGQVLLTGGVDSDKKALTSAELYDPNLQEWRLCAGSMQQARLGHTAVLLFTGKVLIMGGSVSWDSKSGIPSNDAGQWSYTPSTPLEVKEHTVSVTATDQAGNQRDSSAVTFLIDHPVSHYGWGCASTPGLSLSGLWLVASLWLRQRSRRRSSFPLGH